MEPVKPPKADAHPFQHAKTTYQEPSHTNYLNAQTHSLYMDCEKKMGSDWIDDM